MPPNPEIPADLAHRLKALVALHRDGSHVLDGVLDAEYISGNLPVAATHARDLGMTILLTPHAGALPQAAVIPLRRLGDLGIDPAGLERWPISYAEDHGPQLLEHAQSGEVVILTRGSDHTDVAAVVSAAVLAEALDDEAVAAALHGAHGASPSTAQSVTNVAGGEIAGSVFQAADVHGDIGAFRHRGQ